MSAVGVHKITEDFERELCRYTGAKFACCTDNMSNALYLALTYVGVTGKEVDLPSRTYPSVPCEVIAAGAKIKWLPSPEKTLTGEYQLTPTPVWDSALRFTADMYQPGQFQCVSFTGPFKHFKLSKGGAILHDDPKAVEFFIRGRNSGRGECSYHVDNFTSLGRNCYLMPEISARGLLLIQQFYNLDGTKKHNEDLTLPYPDLSKFEVYQKCQS